jgi:hypothetical protein
MASAQGYHLSTPTPTYKPIYFIQAVWYLYKSYVLCDSTLENSAEQSSNILQYLYGNPASSYLLSMLRYYYFNSSLIRSLAQSLTNLLTAHWLCKCPIFKICDSICPTHISFHILSIFSTFCGISTFKICVDHTSQMRECNEVRTIGGICVWHIFH